MKIPKVRYGFDRYIKPTIRNATVIKRFGNEHYGVGIDSDRLAGRVVYLCNITCYYFAVKEIGIMTAYVHTFAKDLFRFFGR